MSSTKEVKSTIANPDIHEGWEKSYRNDENERFFRLAFDAIFKDLKAKPGSKILDAGCGSCRHSTRLAEYGFQVTAIDYAEYIVDKAKEIVAARGFAEKIKVQQEDLLQLSFDDNSFDYVLCWGVLMHIPNIETAISELCRVLKPGGTIIISEVNMNSLEVTLTEKIRPLLNKPHIESKIVPSGVEVWAETEHGKLLSRRANMSWLSQEFSKHGVYIQKRRPGQFTESYTRFQNKTIQKTIHAINNFWFKYLPFPELSCGNILYFKKQD